MREFLEKQANELLAYDEQLVRRLVEKIIVYEERLTVEFKSGLEIDVEKLELRMTEFFSVRQ